MPSIPLYTATSKPSDSPANPLPTLLSTPSGVAILEIQGTIHAPFPTPTDDSTDLQPTQTLVGRLEFPDYDSSTPDDTKWMKKAYFYVGEHQRLVGEVKKLAKPIAVLRKRDSDNVEQDEDSMSVDGESGDQEALEIMEVVKYKILFGARPEPV